MFSPSPMDRRATPNPGCEFLTRVEPPDGSLAWRWRAGMLERLATPVTFGLPPFATLVHTFVADIVTSARVDLVVLFDDHSAVTSALQVTDPHGHGPDIL